MLLMLLLLLMMVLTLTLTGSGCRHQFFLFRPQFLFNQIPSKVGRLIAGGGGGVGGRRSTEVVATIIGCSYRRRCAVAGECKAVVSPSISSGTGTIDSGGGGFVKMQRLDGSRYNIGGGGFDFRI